MLPPVLYEGPHGTLFVLELRYCRVFSGDREVVIPVDDLTSLLLHLATNEPPSPVFLHLHQVLRLAEALRDRFDTHG